MVKRYCDACGAEIKDRTNMVVNFYTARSVDNEDAYDDDWVDILYDLCPKCTTEIALALEEYGLKLEVVYNKEMRIGGVKWK